MPFSRNNGLGSNVGFLDGHQNLTKLFFLQFKNLVEYRLFTCVNYLLTLNEREHLIIVI